jgi:ABC-type multidrug transport system ATPase subunit
VSATVSRLPVSRRPPPADPADCPLCLTGLSKRWRKDLPLVLDRLDLLLAPASCTWVGGRNGAGKTTMLRIAAGLIEPDDGSATVWGRTMRADRAGYQRAVSFLPAGDRGLYARLTVRGQLRFWGRISMIDPRGFERRVMGAVEAFALTDLLDRRVDRMSMGQRQRLRLAMTFLAEPDIVLLDEPLTSLDGEGGELLAEATAAVLARGGAVLWCSPEPEVEYVRFDRSLRLRDGRLVAA